MRTAAAITILIAFSGVAQTFEEISRRADEARGRDQLDQAVRLYRQALGLNPSWAEGWWSLGTIFYDADHYSECTEAFTRFVALKDDVGPAHALLGLCAFGLRDYETALRHLFRAQDLGFGGNPQMREVTLYHTALALILRSNFERAEEQLAILLAASPPTPPVRTAAGLAALRRAILPEQIPDADRELVDRVGDATAAQLQRHQEEAVRLFQAVLNGYPAIPQVHYAYGSLLLNSDPPKGLEMLKAELDISPGHVPAMAAIAYEYLKEDNAAAALPYAEKASRLAPGDFAARVAYGRALLERNRIADAIAQLEVAVRLAPDSPQARFALASAYVRAGRDQDADRERKEFLRLRKLIDSGRK